MSAFLYWLRLGLAAFLAFAPPSLRVDGGVIVANLEAEHMLTQEMRELVAGGVPLSFELYCSAKADSGELSARRVRRSIGYDYLRRSYRIEEEGRSSREAASLGEAEKILKRFDSLSLDLGAGWKRASLFVELRCLGDPLLEKRFGVDGASLWGGYRPSIRLDVANAVAPR